MKKEINFIFILYWQKNCDAYINEADHLILPMNIDKVRGTPFEN